MSRMSEAQILALGRQLGKCYLPDPESLADQPPYRCELAPGHEGLCCTYTYSWIEHDGIGHPGSRIGERFFLAQTAPAL